MSQHKESSSTRNLSAMKLLDILEFFTEQNNKPLRLQDIAQGLSMNSSTVLRFLSSLVEYGYVQQNPETLRYRLTMRICALASKVSASVNLTEVAQPFMRRVRDVFHESVCLGILQSNHVVYIDVLSGPDNILRSTQRIGNNAPVHCTGIGKVLLLNYNDAEIGNILDREGMRVFTKNTLSTPEQLLAEIGTVRQQGYAFDNEECEEGVRCVAVPIRDYTQKVIAGLSVTGTIFRLTPGRIELLLPFLMEQADSFSKELGYKETP